MNRPVDTSRITGLHINIRVMRSITLTYINRPVFFDTRNGRADTVRADEKPSDLEVMRLPDNKASGAVGIRFDVGGSSVAFVCCQLHAGDGIGACSERNRQYHKIANEMFKDVVSCDSK